jgi:hypothetical protein
MSQAILLMFSELNDVNRSIAYAEQIQTKGNLTIIAMGTSTNVSILQQLSPTVIEWKDYSSNSAQLVVAQILDDITCGQATTTTAQTPTTTVTSSSEIPATTVLSTVATSTVATTTADSSQMWFNQCERNILIMADTSRGLTQSQFDQQKAFIVNTLATSGWNHFENFAFATYSTNFVPYPFGTFHSLDEFQTIIDQSNYVGDGADLTRYRQISVIL